MAASRGLGKGLDALFQQNASREQNDSGRGFEYLNIRLIYSNPNQPRRVFSQEALEELAQSIKEQGLLQPLLVRPDPQNREVYQIIAGERRWRACHLAELETVPAIVTKLDDSEALVISLIENLQREDLNPMEEAEAINRIRQELDVSQEDIAQKIGKSRSGIANCLRLLLLEPEIQEAVKEGFLSAGQARSLLGITEPEDRKLLFSHVLSKALTVRQIEEIVSFWKKNGKLPISITTSAAWRNRQEKDPGFDSYRKNLQKQIADQLQAKVNIKGSRQQGQISIKYSSSEELELIVSKFGLDQP